MNNRPPCEQDLRGMVQSLLTERGLTPEVPLSIDSVLYGAGGVGLDSMDMAVLSAKLDQCYGRDPFSAGQFARTMKEILAFYELESSK